MPLFSQPPRCFFFHRPVSAQTGSSTESLDGQWLTDGYGGFIELQGDTLRRYEITTLSCIALAKATRKTQSINANEAVFVGDDGVTFRVSPASNLGHLLIWPKSTWFVQTVGCRQAERRRLA